MADEHDICAFHLVFWLFPILFLMSRAQRSCTVASVEGDLADPLS